MLCDIITYNIHGLPWSRDTSSSIVKWLQSIQPGIICLQEVFCESTRFFYKTKLEKSGYYVSIPNDLGVTALSSGLLIAVLSSKYRVISECFCCFQNYHNVELLANKGFHTIRLIDLSTNRPLVIANTHTQSNTEISWWFGSKASDIRREQFAQMLRFFSGNRQPVLIVGDMNCEYSPHPNIRFLTHSGNDVNKKHTFYSTGEDLDHIGWIPIQWAKPNCHYCNINKLGPIMESCEVYQKPWSDHAPVRASVFIPDSVIVENNYMK